MSLLKKFKSWQFSKLRMEMFSDAVFAIVITLLVLELKVPHIEHPENPENIWHALREITPIVISWVVSFFFVAIMWLHHHNIMGMVTHSDYGVLWINNLLLFFVCLIPFPTAMMGDYPHSPVTVMLWGLEVSLCSLALVWFYYYNAKNFLKESYDKKKVMRNVRLSLFAAPLFYAIGALLAWVSIYISFAMYLVVPFLYMLPLDRETKPSTQTD